MRVAVCCPYFQDSLVESIVDDLRPWTRDIHLWALEGALPRLAGLTRGSGPLGKFETLNRLLPFTEGADLMVFVDDDVRLGRDFLPNYAAAVKRLGAAVAQPALTPDSDYTFPITLARKGCWARLTTFVESGPVVSMTRELLQRVTPFPASNSMGWGLDYHWSAVARASGMKVAVVDAWPVEHTFRPRATRYGAEKARCDMDRFLADAGITDFSQQVLREYRRVYDRRAAYLEAFPAPAEAVAHGADTDAAEDLALLWAVAALVQPAVTVELGTRGGVSTRALVHAAREWDGRVITADPVDCRHCLGALPCEFVQASGEELFGAWDGPVDLLFFDTDPHSYRQTRRWLDTWVKTWLADGGVAVFHDVVATRPQIRVAEAVRDWLREQPRGWCWQEFGGTSGLGLLWRLSESEWATGLSGMAPSNPLEMNDIVSRPN
jgi:predicted O-methyltransferase YrrM